MFIKIVFRYLAFAQVPLLLHAKEVYTIPLYLQFEDRFMKGVSCSTKIIHQQDTLSIYHVGRPHIDLIMHTVVFDNKENTVDCTCKSFTETGMLCAHSLRVYINHSVLKIPTKYIMKRWTKQAMNTDSVDYVEKVQDVIVPAAVWRMQNIRKFIGLIHTSQNNMEARKIVENSFTDLKGKLMVLLGNINEEFNAEGNIYSTLFYIMLFNLFIYIVNNY